MGRINTATRPFYCPSKREGQAFFEDEVEFGWHSGMSWQVRQRSSDAMRDAILERYAKGGLRSEEILEVSTASHDYEVGQALSAMNLSYADPDTSEIHPVENWFQASKVFKRDGAQYGPYRELLRIRLAKRYVSPNLDRKTIEQLQGDPLFDRIQSEVSGAKMSCFILNDGRYPLVPRSAFYDYLYVSALTQPQNAVLAQRLMPFRVFTDIMFNPGTGKKKKFNTQARSCAIFVALARRGVLDGGMPSFEEFVAEVSYDQEDAGSSEAASQRLFVLDA